MKLPYSLSALAILGLAAAPLAASGNGEGPPEGSTLVGKVVFEGDELPTMEELDVSSKPEHEEHCMAASDRKARTLIVDPESKGIANVFVEIRKVTKDDWTPEAEFAPSDQLHCRFEPHVMVVPTGVDITFKNSDPFMHNVHFYCVKNKAENFGIPENGSKAVTLKSDEKIRIKCDVHTWMDSWMIATSNPYHALTGADGSFSIEGVPEGKYEIRFWHESLGTLKKKKVEFDGSGEVALDITSSDSDWKQ